MLPSGGAAVLRPGRSWKQPEMIAGSGHATVAVQVLALQAHIGRVDTCTKERQPFLLMYHTGQSCLHIVHVAKALLALIRSVACSL